MTWSLKLYWNSSLEQLQLSECITKSRRYIREVTGVDGFVDQGKVQADAFSNRFKSENIVSDNPDVQNWMSNITADKKGWAIYYIDSNWIEFCFN